MIPYQGLGAKKGSWHFGAVLHRNIGHKAGVMATLIKLRLGLGERLRLGLRERLRLRLRLRQKWACRIIACYNHKSIIFDTVNQPMITAVK
jgi:hypothetical protein